MEDTIIQNNFQERIKKIISDIKREAILDYIYLLIGCFLFVFVGWRWNMPFAAWISPIFLMRFFRNQKKFWPTVIALPILAIISYLKMRDGWHISILFQIMLSIIVPILFVMIPLYIDRFIARRYKSILGSLVYPSVIVFIEYMIGLTLLGSFFYVGGTQFRFGIFLQLSTITSIWGLSFLISWTASVINTFWDKDFKFDFKKPPRLAKIYSAIIISTMLFGTLRLAFSDPSSPTVRVGSISVEHQTDYWTEIIDKQTPADEASLYLPEIQALEDQLFSLSEQAVNGGAKIIFWSEGNCPYYEDYEQEFYNRSKTFAMEHNIYFAPGVVKFYYDSYISDNKVVMFDPNGTLVIEYIKTKSWYEGNSDGIIPSVDTPYGRLAVTICFDNDFPNFIRQVGKAKADILLMPAFDVVAIKEFHAETSLIRGIENGVNVVRHVNKGCSYAIDYLGNIIAYQDHFDTAILLMYSDVPTERAFTLYAILGDWFAYSSFALMGLILADFVFRQTKKRPLFSKKNNNESPLSV
ncbi:MAG: nitrilase-related carbon-nitrogen hydrolase [Candidatus Heimdallarchaeota archaeon]